MATGQQLQDTIIDQNAVNILSANIGTRLTAAELAAVFLPNRVRWVRGCISRLYYGSGDDDLDYIVVGGQPIRAENLKDFRDRLKDAACCHHCISFCLDTQERRMFMLNVWPCLECKPTGECECK